MCDEFYCLHFVVYDDSSGFNLYIFDLQPHKGNRTHVCLSFFLFFFFLGHILMNVLEPSCGLSVTASCVSPCVLLCVRVWVCGVPYDWTDNLFILRFLSHTDVFS